MAKKDTIYALIRRGIEDRVARKLANYYTLSSLKKASAASRRTGCSLRRRRPGARRPRPCRSAARRPGRRGGRWSCR